MLAFMLALTNPSNGVDILMSIKANDAVMYWAED
jgi:hypothetical protein